MITALCMNPCIDRTISLKGFTYGGMNRVVSSREDGAGKGVNVALAGKQAGLPMACIGLLGQERGEPITRRLAEAGVPCEFVPTPGAVRMNIKLLDEAAGQITEINEPGAPVSPQTLEKMVDMCAAWAKKSRVLILAGSLPAGCPADFYARVMVHVRSQVPDCKLVVDAEGERLTCTLEHRPWLIKPNRYELELMAGRSLPTLSDVADEGKHLLDRGVEQVIISLGSEGALALSAAGIWYAPAIPCEVASTVGAGDSMLAAAAAALADGLSLPEALRRGCALATAAVATPGTGRIDMRLYEEFYASARCIPV